MFLAGDAAHINNPLGGMGMNGGIHDAFNLTDRLADVWNGTADMAQLDLYDRQRLLAGDTLSGPAIIEQMDTTVVVPPDTRVEVEESGNLIIVLD